MKKILGVLVVGMIVSTQAWSATWIARCNNLQFNFDDRVGAKALVYFKTDTGIYQMAKGKITVSDGTSVRAPLDGNGVGFSGGPLTRIGLNRPNRYVFVEHIHPTTGVLTTGLFCHADISVL